MSPRTTTFNVSIWTCLVDDHTSAAAMNAPRFQINDEDLPQSFGHNRREGRPALIASLANPFRNVHAVCATRAFCRPAGQFYTCGAAGESMRQASASIPWSNGDGWCAVLLFAVRPLMAAPIWRGG
jgi:hypothetical protein